MPRALSPSLAPTLALLALAGAAPTAQAQPVPFAQRTGGVLVSDLSGDRLLLFRDTNGDGQATSPGESTVFLDASNLSGMGNISGAIFSMVALADGSVIIGDGDTGNLYRLRDLNNDGDANDQGEATLAFSGIIAQTFVIPTPNGLATDDLGRIYCANAGNLTLTTDTVFRFEDTDNSGDFNGGGESTIFADFSALNAPTSSVPFDIVIKGSEFFVVDSGPNPDVVYKFSDTDGDGTIAASERSVFLVSGQFGAVSIQGMASDGTALYFIDRTASAANLNVQKVYKAVDLDGSGAIDAQNELTIVWTEAAVPAGFVLTTAFAIAAGPSGTLAITSSGSDNADNAFLLRDLDGNGRFDDEGETTVLGDATLLDTARTLTFIKGAPAPTCSPDYNGTDGVNGDDLADYIADFFDSTGIQPGFAGPIAIPGGFAANATAAFNGFGRPCPSAIDVPQPNPWGAPLDAYRTGGFKVSLGINNDACSNPNGDDLADYISVFFNGCP
jgi:hypothetical protein